MGKFNYTLGYKCGHTENKVHYFSGEQLSEGMELNLAKQINNALYQDCAECKTDYQKAENKRKQRNLKRRQKRALLKVVPVKMPYWQYQRDYIQFKLLPEEFIEKGEKYVYVLLPDKNRTEFNRLWSEK